jgi:hypothetical protein
VLGATRTGVFGAGVWRLQPERMRWMSTDD